MLEKIIERTVETIAAETAEIAALKATDNTIETVIIISVKDSASKEVEKINSCRYKRISKRNDRNNSY